MVNHIRTLLLNKNSSADAGWYIDPSFNPIKLTGTILKFHDILFSYGDSLSTIEYIMPFLMDVEFKDIVDGLDTRSTVETNINEPSSIVSFYKTLSTDNKDTILSCINSGISSSLFSYSEQDSDFFVSSMKKLSSVFNSSKETTKRFSACILAYVLHLDKTYNKSKR